MGESENVGKAAADKLEEFMQFMSKNQAEKILASSFCNECEIKLIEKLVKKSMPQR